MDNVTKAVRMMRTRRDIALDYALATGLSAWGTVIGFLSLLGFAPSKTISALPGLEILIWSVVVMAAGISTLVGLFALRSVLAVSRGLLLMAVAITIYWISIIAVSGWNNGGAVATFLLVVSAVITRESVALRQRVIPRNGGDGGRDTD